MSFLHKLGIGIGIGVGRDVSRPVPSNTRTRQPGGAQVPAVSATRAPEMNEPRRLSNGLKEFLWNLDGLGRGTLLDLGPAWQTTLNFFIERGFRVSSEDVLREWKDFLADEAKMRDKKDISESLDLTATGRATRFLQNNLQYAPASFDAILLWDVLDYLEPTVAKQMVSMLTDLSRPGAVVFAMFHSKKPETFQRYRVLDSNTLQVISTPALCPAQRAYQNREIQDLFGRYRTMKSFVGRDQLRETLFIK